MDTVKNNNLQNNQNVSPKQIARNDSYFDGNTWQLIGYRILSALVNTITLGVAYPWMLCMVQRWEVKHTVIHGRRLKFNGHGHQLIGKYLLWVFLTIITFGIYGIWLGLGMKKWVVKHTVYADEECPVDSYFSGGAGGYFGIHILSFVLTLFTFGIGKAWADKMVLKWEAKHTHIGGSPLEFNGTGGQLFVKYLLFVLLTPLTLGIYALFFTVIYMKWQVKHTEAVYQTPEIQVKVKAHEMTAIQDFAKYRIAANDQEIAAMKSGYTGKEDNDTLERLAGEGNSFAAYHLAKQVKGDNTIYDGRALELLQKSADGKVHSALLDLAKQQPIEQAIPMLTEAAQYGNAEASWLLAIEYQKTADLTKAAYWFKVALEWDVANAKAHTAEYDELVKNIALQLSENREMPKQSKKKFSPIVWCGVAIAGVLLVAGIVFGVMFMNAVNDPSHSFMGSRIARVSSNSMAPEIETGDVIYLDDDISNVLIGDIIAFICDEYGTIAVHRVHDIVTNDDGEIRYITKGDNNEYPDTNPVHPANVIGVYKHKASFIGEILGSFQSSAVGNYSIDWGTPLEGDDNQEKDTQDNNIQNTETSDTSETATMNIAKSIVGKWTACNNIEYISDGDMTLARCLHINFSADGTFEVYQMTHMIYNDGTSAEMTTPHLYGGTYSVESDVLKLHYTLFNSGAPDSSNTNPTLTEFQIDVDDGVLQVDGMKYFDESFDTFYRDKTVKEIANNK